MDIISVQNIKLSYAIAELQLRKPFCIFTSVKSVSDRKDINIWSPKKVAP